MSVAQVAYTEPAALRRYLSRRRRLVDRALARLLPRATTYPPVIHQAMRYSVLAGGKRVRAIVCLAACEAVGGRVAEVLPAACALECIHAYSLIHDDLPAMDDAATRRGQPACHRRYGEGIAILAGDALLSLGFELLTRGNHPTTYVRAAKGSPPTNGRPANGWSRRWWGHVPRRLRALQDVARIIGTEGLIGGQVMDLAWQRREARGKGQAARRLIEYINANKTAKLMAVSAKLGALLGGGTPAQVHALERYGLDLGLVFQLTDDVLDREGMVALLGAAATRAQARRIATRARRRLRGFDAAAAQPLRQLVDAIVWRTT